MCSHDNTPQKVFALSNSCLQLPTHPQSRVKEEGLVQADDIGMFALGKDVYLYHEVLQLRLVLDGHSLQCRQHTRVSVLCLQGLYQSCVILTKDITFMHLQIYFQFDYSMFNVWRIKIVYFWVNLVLHVCWAAKSLVLDEPQLDAVGVLGLSMHH